MMAPGLQTRLDELVARHEDLAQELAQHDVANDLERYKRLAQEYAQLETLVANYAELRELQEEQHSLQTMLRDDDADVRALAQAELVSLPERMQVAEAGLRSLLVPCDPHDGNNVFVEIRAGTGGDEAALFAGDLLRMYSRYAEAREWHIDILSASEGEAGGYKEVILRVQGEDVYSRMKFESGGHRVQRVPTTETQGRVHTSAATVAVLPELDEVEVDINPAELRVDTFRASGAGGQHVNKTDSAIRITHLPTGVVVECQQERSQHKNRARAMSLLAARLRESEEEKQRSERAAERKSLVGSGDRSQRIRTYNFPQNRVTDHRINLTLYNLEEVVQGALDQVIDPLLTQHQADALAAIGVEAN